MVLHCCWKIHFGLGPLVGFERVLTKEEHILPGSVSLVKWKVYSWVFKIAADDVKETIWFIQNRFLLMLPHFLHRMGLLLAASKKNEKYHQRYLDGDSTLHWWHGVDTDDVVHTVDMIYTVETVYTIQTALRCLNINMSIYLLRKVRTLLKCDCCAIWAKSRVDGLGAP